MAMKFEKKSDGVYALDVCGYVCPHPQIYCKKSLEKIGEGEILEMTFDNPSSAETIVQMLDQAGHDLMEKKNEGGKIIYKIKKA
jgi:tRNA 2-thiouridine synthesizing protein A